MALEQKGYRIEPFDVNNYKSWSFQMEMILIDKDLWHCVTEEGSTRIKAKDDMKARATIALCVKPHHASLLAGTKTAKEAWNALKKLYDAQGTAGRMQLLQRLQGLRLEPDEPMTKYFSRVRELRDELAAVGDPVTDTQLVLNLLNGLPTEYDIEKVLISSQVGDPGVEDTFATLLRAEQRVKAKLELESAGDDKAAFMAKQQDDRVCYHCGKRGHIKRRCKEYLHEKKALMATAF